MANRVLLFDSEPTNRKSETILTLLICKLKKKCMCVCIHVLVYIRIYRSQRLGFFISSHYMSSKILEVFILH